MAPKGRGGVRLECELGLACIRKARVTMPSTYQHFVGLSMQPPSMNESILKCLEIAIHYQPCTHSPSSQRIKGGLNRSTFSSPAAASSSSALVSGGSSRGGRTPSFPKSLPLPLRHPSPQGCISIMRQYTDKQITGHTTLHSRRKQQ